MKINNNFVNLDNTKVGASLKDLLRWRRERSRKQKDLSFVVPQSPDKKLHFIANNRSESTITWIGHATLLIQLSGLNILTDPVWATKMGFEKRLALPGMGVTDLPEIDVVLISHNHYDHLDIKTIQKLKGNPLCLVPKGVGSLLSKRGIPNFEEFHWWETKTINQVEFIFVPAQHWSKRTLWDTNKSLWGGWMINKVSEDGEKEDGVYFVGDSSYFNGFAEIGRKYKINYMLVPIGAYESEWFMHAQHATPEEAVKAFLEAGAKYFIPMHYDAFRLGDDTPKEAIDRLQREWHRLKLESAKLKILQLGETVHNLEAVDKL